MKTLQTILQLIIYAVKHSKKDFQEIIGNIDTMTGLYNRNKLEQDKSTFKSGNYICITDANGLKIVNDRLGHAQGDILIQSIGKFLKAICKDSYRIGGDEFLLYMQEDKYDEIESMLSHCHLNISYGFAEIHHDIDIAIQQGDERMYEMKSTKRKVTY